MILVYCLVFLICVLVCVTLGFCVADVCCFCGLVYGILDLCGLAVGFGGVECLLVWFC